MFYNVDMTIINTLVRASRSDRENKSHSLINILSGFEFEKLSSSKINQSKINIERDSFKRS